MERIALIQKPVNPVIAELASLVEPMQSSAGGWDFRFPSTKECANYCKELGIKREITDAEIDESQVYFWNKIWPTLHGNLNAGQRRNTPEIPVRITLRDVEGVIRPPLAAASLKPPTGNNLPVAQPVSSCPWKKNIS